MNTVWEQWVLKGGVMMGPLLLCSFLGLTIIIYKAIVFWRERADVDALISRVEQKIRANQRGEALAACEEFGGPAARMMATIITSGAATREVAREAVEECVAVEIDRLESYLRGLNTLAYIAPLLGFLGTVWGMIVAFNDVATANEVTPRIVASGISQALITTATGLIIAVPFYAAYNYFVGRVDSFALEMGKAATRLLQVLYPEEAKRVEVSQQTEA